MDNIKVGLDFGTHQTKICIKITPDEGHGEPRYEFFQFKDLKGRKHYLLPSIVQINEDNTLSYGFVDPSKSRFKLERPSMQPVDYWDDEFDREELVDELYEKYSSYKVGYGSRDVLRTMLEAKRQKAEEHNSEEEKKAKESYNLALQEYYKNSGTFRYFKQSTFAGRPWTGMIPCDILSIWYISYVIFLLEKVYGENFSINMGVPADEKNYLEKKNKAISILLSAYKIVEDVYQNDFNAFLNEKVDVLFEKTKKVPYSYSKKEEYVINIFPEAFASLTSLTSRGKISPGLCLNADIGGGTTDISFFAVEKNSKDPFIYRYWSLPYGLNYIAEQSGYDYTDIEKVFESKSSKSVIELFDSKINESILQLYNDLIAQLRKETNLNQTPLHKALADRIVVYNGGGSKFDFICGPVRLFTDVLKIDSETWNESNIIDSKKVDPICHLLSTAYGLSIGEDDNKVGLSPFTILFKGIYKESQKERQMVDKDLC